MKKTNFTIFLIILLVTVCINNVLAVDVGELINIGDSTSSGSGDVDTKLTNIMNNALGVISVVGVTIAFGMLVFVGMKLMSAAPSEKADVKKYLVPFVIGAVCILGSIFVLNLMSGFGEELNNVMK